LTHLQILVLVLDPLQQVHLWPLQVLAQGLAQMQLAHLLATPFQQIVV
jgi:hypothetical protein